jgi:hypothetical protein
MTYEQLPIFMLRDAQKPMAPVVNKSTHDRAPATSKHEKKLYPNLLFNSKLRLFSREAISLIEGGESNRDVTPTTPVRR